MPTPTPDQHGPIRAVDVLTRILARIRYVRATLPTFRFSGNRATTPRAGKAPRCGPTWARIGHDQAFRANLTASGRRPSSSTSRRRPGRATASVSATPRKRPLRRESQVAVRTASTAACLSWEAPSVNVRWRPSLATVVVTHLVTRPCACPEARGPADLPIFRRLCSPGESVTDCLSEPYDTLTPPGVHLQCHASTVLDSTALARSAVSTVPLVGICLRVWAAGPIGIYHS